MIHIIKLHHPRLTIETLCLKNGSCCFYGSGRSGINEFLSLFEGKLSGYHSENLELPSSPTIISYAIQQEIFEEEIRNDDSDFLDRVDPGTLAHEFLPPDSLDSNLIDLFDMRASLTTGYRQLSSGQSRKLLLLRALLSGATTIILDSPYDGLDPDACNELDQLFGHLSGHSLQIIVLARNIGDIPYWCTQLGIFEKNQLTHLGERDEILPIVEKLNSSARRYFQTSILQGNESQETQTLPIELISLTNGFGGYAEKVVFSGLNLTLSCNQHTLVTGPNGCGKSTLLQIITGDNPKCYANDLKVFGIQRGSGESIWEIKRHMGIVSPEIHRSYRVPGSVLNVVLSGLFDSIGLYQQVTALQKREARKWLSAIDIDELAPLPFRSLSYGDQRLVLIARALIKQPPLLILDEPTHGLDSAARMALLDFLATIARNGQTTILYVSHRQDEHRSFFEQHIQLGQYQHKPITR